ncbi:transcriptional regulator, GntR family [Austwickia chelonae]|uniref:Putative GntR family transcriptional regulator n=1 Tax=Austwickia chelonae NBRC 105200 TaxID=1184607 RepID=K6VUN6_9MICO|nr:GntR family transcriptional regulator [Austwickia chelonae]GAB79020.1 putative GntR family transcriptional regulator [Austwickia chelonae NBRC 105200]SEW41680.1 transcriptional regulator, GntR family [Austwickia chelonae]
MTAPLPIHIDRTSTQPLYLQLARQLLTGIDNGELPPGSLLETEVDLARRLHLSRPTVRRAIAVLVAKELLVRRRGVGTVVATGKVRQQAELNSLYDDLSAEHRSPRTKLLTLEEGAVHRQAALALGLPPRTALIHITRLRSVGDIPLAILENWLPPDSPVLPALTPERLEQDGLYSILRGEDLAPHTAEQTFGARNATGAERQLLDLTRADPLLTMWRSAYDADGRIIECGDHRYRGDQYSISVTVALDDGERRHRPGGQPHPDLR